MKNILQYCVIYSLKVASLIGPLAVTAYFVHHHGLSVLGEFALLNSYAIGIAFLSKFGFDALIEREASRSADLKIYSDAGRVLSSLTLILTVLLSLTIVSFDRFGVLTPILLGLWSIGYSTNFLISASLRAEKKFKIATIILTGNIQFVLIALIFLLGVKQISNTIAILAIGPFVVSTLFLITKPIASEVLKEILRRPSGNILMSMKESQDFFYINATSFLRKPASFWFMGAFFSAETLGAFRILTQVNTLLNFPVTVANIVAPQRISYLWGKNRVDEIKRFSISTAQVTLLIGIPCLIIFAFFRNIINDFIGLGADEIIYIVSLMILCQGINLATGTLNATLTMTSHADIARNNAFISSAFYIVIFGILTYYFELIGAISAFSLAIILDNILGVRSVKRKLGFWLLPIRVTPVGQN